MCPQLFMELFLKSCFQNKTGGMKPVLFSQRFTFTELEERHDGEGKKSAVLQASKSSDSDLQKTSHQPCENKQSTLLHTASTILGGHKRSPQQDDQTLEFKRVKIEGEDKQSASLNTSITILGGQNRSPQQDGQTLELKRVKIEGEAGAGASHSSLSMLSWLKTPNPRPVLTSYATQVLADVRGPNVRARGEGASKHKNQPPKDEETWEG